MLASGCAFVSPRFSQEVQASFARDEMRKLTTRSLELYYPEHLKPSALRVCIPGARAKGVPRELFPVFARSHTKREPPFAHTP